MEKHNRRWIDGSFIDIPFISPANNGYSYGMDGDKYFLLEGLDGFGVVAPKIVFTGTFDEVRAEFFRRKPSWVGHQRIR